MDDARSICIVANELKYLFRNGGIGTHNWLLAESLADAGWRVHVLYCAEIDDPATLSRIRTLWAPKRISLWHLDMFATPEVDRPQCGVIGALDTHSMRVRRALEQLNALHHFDLIEFGEWSGYAFRSIQARKMGLSFPNARMIVRLHASNQWCRDANRRWMDGPHELLVDYYERYGFENADYQLSPSKYMFDYARKIGWNVRGDAQVIPYCYPTSVERLTDCKTVPPELVFFGRLEQRKGLKIFLQAVKSLPAEIPVTFLGKDVPIDGVPALTVIAEHLANRSYTLHTSFNNDQAMDYLRDGSRIAVMPSLTENYPFTVLECATAGIPFLAAGVGGIPEIVNDSALRQALLFEPTAVALRNQIDRYLDTPAQKRSQYVQRMHEISNSVRNNSAVCKRYTQLIDERPDTLKRTEVEAKKPLVTVTVPYYNMGDFLPETLASLAAQDYAPIEVLVVDDGSTEPKSLDVFQLMQSKYPQFKFIRQTNQGLGAARNTGLSIAQGKYFLPVDSDNVARPDMVSTFVRTMERNPQLSTATCFTLAFEQSADIAAGKFCYAYRPCGGPYVAASMMNVYGDANAMFLTAALRSVGGYETDKDTGYEDWEIYVKLARSGHRLDVIPDYLFYYRHRATSMQRTMDLILSRRRVLRQFFPDASLPRSEQIQLWTMLASLSELWNQQWRFQHVTGQVVLETDHGITRPKKKRSTPVRVAREIRRVVKRLSGRRANAA